MAKRRNKVQQPASRVEPRNLRAPATSAAANLANAAKQPQVAWFIVAFLATLLSYLWIFYTSSGDEPGKNRLTYLLLLFIPEKLVASWFDGSVANFHLLDRAPVLTVAAVIWAWAYVAGRLLMELVGAQRGLSRLEAFVFAMGVGLNVLSLWTLAVGLLGGLRQPLLFAVPAVALVAIGAWRWTRTWHEFTTREEKTPAPAQRDWLPRGALWLGLPFVLVILLGSMLPPRDFDVREYHLQVPKEWYQQGRIDFLPHNVYGNMPLGAEMHALLAMVIMPGERDWWWGAMAGKTVMGGFSLLTALGLFAAGRRFCSTTAGVVAALVYISIPWVAMVSISGLNEGASAFYLLLSVYAVLIWSRERGASKEHTSAPQSQQPSNNSASPSLPLSLSPHHLLLAGFLAGAAVACKYPAVLFVVLPLVAWLLFGRRGFDWRPAGIFLLAVVVGCGLWFGKNWVLTGNPTYPLLYELFDGKSRTPEKNQQWQRAHAVPRDAAGQRYSSAQLGDSLAIVAWRSQLLSPILWPLAALALFIPRQRRLVLVLLCMFVYGLAAWWLLTHRIERFWVPALPIVALLAGIGATWTTARLWRHVLVGVLFWGLVANFFVIASPATGDNRYLVSLDQLRLDVPDDEDEISRINPAHRYLNQHVPDGYRVLLVGDAQPFDLEVPALYNTCFDDCLFEQLMKGHSKDVRTAKLRELRVSHIYIQWSEIDRYRSPGNYGFTDYVTPALVRAELTKDQGILRIVRAYANQDGDIKGEVFEVVGVAPDVR